MRPQPSAPSSESPLIGDRPEGSVLPSERADWDWLLVGGGLQNALITLALLHRDPGARLALIERAPRCGGNHTWCFHDGDVGGEPPAWLLPLVVRAWPAHEVRFPGLQRVVPEAYSAISSERLGDVVSQALRQAPNARLIRAEARQVAPGRLELNDGKRLEGRWVVDARGPEQLEVEPPCGYQKFVGLELSVAPGSAPTAPTLMDATVPQADGLRFFYTLPLSPERVLVEDTYYSESATLNAEGLRAQVLEYAASRGLAVAAVERQEVGVLPIPLRAPRPQKIEPGLLRAGYGGGFFHPTTGYSFPAALRLALCLAATAPGRLALELGSLVRKLVAQQRYAAWLNRLLFQAFAPSARYQVLERFYRLDPGVIRRFYALRSTPLDRARILCGRPPGGTTWAGLARAVGG